MGLFQNKKAVLIKIECLDSTVYKCSVCGEELSSETTVCPRCNSKFSKIVSDPVWIDEMADED